MAAPYPPAPAPTRPPLRRPRQGRVLAGVGAGLADHLGIDVAIVRVLIVVVTIVTQGLGLLAYVLGAVFIPAEAEAEAAAAAGSATPAPSSEQPPRSGMFWVGIALLVVGVLALINGPLSSFGLSFGLGSGVLGPLVLIGFGLALWVAGDRARPATPAPPAAAWTPPASSSPSFPPSTDPAALAARQEPPMTSDPASPTDHDPASSTDPGPAATGAWSPQPTGDPAAGGVPPGSSANLTPGQPPAQPPVWTPPPVPGRGSSEPEAWEPPPAPERERSALGQLTVGLALLTAGVLWLLSATGVLAADAGHVLAASLLVIGLGLLVGSVLGRARWLIVVGLILLPLVLASAAVRTIDLVEIPFGGGFGERVYAPEQVDELPARIELAAGTVEVDLTGILDAQGDVPLEVRVGAGEIDVVVPEGAGLEVRAGVQVGVMDLLGSTSEGFPGVRELGTDLGTPQPADPGAPTYVLDLRIGAGDLSVSRGPAADDADLDLDLDLDTDADEAAADLLLDLAA